MTEVALDDYPSPAYAPETAPKPAPPVEQAALSPATRRPNVLSRLQAADLLAWFQAEWPTIQTIRPTMRETAAKYNAIRVIRDGFKDVTPGNIRGTVSALALTWPAGPTARAQRGRAILETRFRVLAADFIRFVKHAQAGQLEEFSFSKTLLETYNGRQDP